MVEGSGDAKARSVEAAREKVKSHAADRKED
jgi:hypothetical protein